MIKVVSVHHTEAGCVSRANIMMPHHVGIGNAHLKLIPSESVRVTPDPANFQQIRLDTQK